MFFGSKFSFAWVWLWCKPKAFPFTVTWDSSGRRSLIFAIATFSNPRDVCPRSVAPVGSWGPNFPLSAAVTSRVLRGTELRCRGATTLAGQMRREMSKPLQDLGQSWSDWRPAVIKIAFLYFWAWKLGHEETLKQSVFPNSLGPSSFGFGLVHTNPYL